MQPSRMVIARALTTLTICAVIWPSASLAQSAIESAADRQRQLIEEIEREQLRAGPHSEALIDPMTSLALLYLEDGDTALASVTVEQILQVMRANYGLYSLRQAPLIWQLIENADALGNVDAAWNLQQELEALASRNPEDLRSVPVFRGLAERRLHLLEQFKAGEFPREFFLGCYYEDPADQPDRENRSCVSGSRSFAIGRILLDVHRYYAEAIEVLLRNELYESEQLRELELEAVRATFTSGLAHRGVPCEGTLGELLEMEPLESCLEPIQEVDENLTRLNVGGEASLVRLLSYEVRSSAPQLTQLSALIELADWLHSRHLQSSMIRRANDSALELYDLAIERLRELGETSTIENIFSPSVPVVLPVFVPTPLVSEEPSQFSGYVEVAFDVTKLGEGDRIEILETRDVSRKEERELIRTIEQTVFRPRAVRGQLVDRSRVTVRYYLGD